MEVEEGIRGVLARLHVTCRGHVNTVALEGGGCWGQEGSERGTVGKKRTKEGKF